MHLSIISDELSLDLEESLQAAEEFGIRKFEIRCLDDYEHRIPNFRPGRLERLEELVSAGTIELTALSPGTFKIPLSDTQQVRRELDQTLPRTCEIARALKVPRVIVFAFLREPGKDAAEAINRLKEAAAIAEAHDLELCIENEPGAWCDTGVNTAAIVKAIGQEHVGVNWDPANAVYSGEAAYPVGYDAVRPLIRNVHLKDGIPLPDGKWENRLIGDGGVNWIGQLRAFRRDQPVSFYTLETHVFPLMESTREDLRRLRILEAAVHEFENA
jgi:sugar phosphate isomerase/epimerase